MTSIKQSKNGNNAFKISKMKIIGGILIVAIAILALFATGYIIKKSKSDTLKLVTEISTESNNINSEFTIKFMYADNYWEKYDLTNAVYKTQSEYETAVLNYIEQITTLL